MTIKPKHLVVNLLLAAQKPVSTQVVVTVCELFGITENNARVTLARLTAESLLKTAGRGFYQLGDGAVDLAAEMSQWRTREELVCQWKGDWVAVYIGALGRTDRTGLRRRLRVLQLAGFEALEQDLWIRPNNLNGSVAEQRRRLYRLGLEESSRVMGLKDFSSKEQVQAQQLWNIDQLHERYQRETQEMLDWMSAAQQLSVEDAVRQSFLMGDRVLRNIAYDPLLPCEMIDVDARVHYLKTMIEYDRCGNGFFEKIYRRLGVVN